MTASLYEVKNKFSEYVSRAQNGEIIEVQKYGKPAVVIISAEKYNETQTQKSNLNWYKEWRKESETLLDNEYAHILEKIRKTSVEARQNPFGEIAHD